MFLMKRQHFHIETDPFYNETWAVKSEIVAYQSIAHYLYLFFFCLEKIMHGPTRGTFINWCQASFAIDDFPWVFVLLTLKQLYFLFKSRILFSYDSIILVNFCISLVKYIAHSVSTVGFDDLVRQHQGISSNSAGYIPMHFQPYRD